MDWSGRGGEEETNDELAWKVEERRGEIASHDDLVRRLERCGTRNSNSRYHPSCFV